MLFLFDVFWWDGVSGKKYSVSWADNGFVSGRASNCKTLCFKMKAVSNMEELLVQATSGQGVWPAGKNHIHFGTVNVGTSGRANEVVEMITQRKVDLCCLQETRWRGGSACLIKGNNNTFKFFWCGDQSGLGVEIILAEKWVNNISVKR